MKSGEAYNLMYLFCDLSLPEHLFVVDTIQSARELKETKNSYSKLEKRCKAIQQDTNGMR